ncbi:LysE family translocator [Shewanella nanhaiensis]|uniref:LysE family translocator n=1 Tax=Shewanella nanhaiensis TaxID=2864872 RepID=A0ABS7E377_9GAMM|nr:LysE family translocator [Shewanella nanhaiensis]MBW8184109.1 LysE family translocator [Shewanella nanhaiensis]
MFGITDLWLFVISGIALNIMPGPDSLYVIGRSGAQGFRAGSTASFGIASGTLVHIFAAAFGLSAILATSATAFTVIKILGCCYLVYMGLSMILSRKDSAEGSMIQPRPTSQRKIFSQGFLTNVLNPKVALFFLAFVPQFIAYDAPNKVLSFLILGLIFNINGMIWCHLLAWSSASVGRRVKQSRRVNQLMNQCAGALFICFGIKLALSEQN